MGDKIRKVTGTQGSLGPLAVVNTGFISEWDGKPLYGLAHKNDMI